MGDAAVHLSASSEMTVGISIPSESITLLVQPSFLTGFQNFDVTLYLDEDGLPLNEFEEGARMVRVYGGFDGPTFDAVLISEAFTADITANVVAEENDAAGYFVGQLLGTNSGQWHLFFGTTPEAFGILSETDSIEGGLGTVPTNDRNSFMIRMHNSDVVQGTIDYSTRSINGAVEDATTTNERAHLMGLQKGAMRTDRVTNLSRRGKAGSSSEGPLIAGFVIAGADRKELLIRAAGPTLEDFGVLTASGDPRMALYSAQTQIAADDDWGSSVYPEGIAAAAGRVGAFTFPEDSLDSAMLSNLLPGAYTTHVNSKGTSGTALFEVYDASADPGTEQTRLSNLSTRGHVEGDEGILICGFVIGGNHPKRVLIRAAGFTLAGYGVEDFLTDPLLSLFEGERLVTSNDNWENFGTGIISSAGEVVGAFPFEAGSNESAILVTLPPGVYTAHVAGVDGATGESLVEIYEVD